MGAAFRVRWDSEALVDAVATTTGEASAAKQRPGGGAEMHAWDLRASFTEQTWGFGAWYSWIENPTLPANRRFKLTPHVKCIGDWAGFSVGASFRVHMIHAVVMDVPDRSTVGW
jgi:hypothetical protein